MPLTRNLYREDEVRAALNFCILKGRLQESMFWAHEMIQSNMTAELLQSLFWLWMNFFGSAHLSWYSWFHELIADLESVDEESIYLLVVSLGRANANKRNDSTVFALLLTGLSRVPTDNVGFVVLPPNLRVLEGPSKTFAIAVKQGKLELAWSLWPENAWLILEELAKEHTPFIKALSNESSSPLWKSEWDFPVRALALTIVGSLSRPVLITEKEQMLKELVGIESEWKGSMRQSRVYTVPQECLQWFTRRGALPMNKTTEKELKSGLENALVGSQFWDELDWTSSDDAREEFFETYFTSDIPDEWSSNDRKKSHGYGVLPISDVNYDMIRLNTFTRWFQSIPSKGLWLGIETAIKYMTEKMVESQQIDTAIQDAYEEADISKRVTLMNIRSVKRKLLEV
jgi:hypothetical protein